MVLFPNTQEETPKDIILLKILLFLMKLKLALEQGILRQTLYQYQMNKK